jgi:probable rRNA maturation factor
MVAINNIVKARINKKKTLALMENFLADHKRKEYFLSLALVDAEKIHYLNKEYRGIDKTTDVLSFSGDEFANIKKHKYFGEVLINMEEVRQVKNYLDVFDKVPRVEYLFYFILVHGLLHLLGYNDISEKGRLKMLRMGKKFLTKNAIIE